MSEDKSAEPETTWEKVQFAVLREWPDGFIPSDPAELNDVGLMCYALAAEVDDLRRRNAELERTVREMAVKCCFASFARIPTGTTAPLRLSMTILSSATS